MHGHRVWEAVLMLIPYVLHNVTSREAWLSISDTPCAEVTPEYYEESNHVTHEKGEKKHERHGSVEVVAPAGYVPQGYRPVMIRMPVDDIEQAITKEIEAYVLAGVPAPVVEKTQEEIDAEIDAQLADVEALAVKYPDRVTKKLNDRVAVGALEIVDKDGTKQPEDKVRVK